MVLHARSYLTAVFQLDSTMINLEVLTQLADIYLNIGQNKDRILGQLQDDLFAHKAQTATKSVTH